MKLVSFGPRGAERPGVVLGDERILDLYTASGGAIDSIRRLLEAGDDAMGRVRRWIENDPPADWLLSARSVRFGPPVNNPTKVVGVGLNYRTHAEEQKARIPARPLLFSKAVTSLAGHNDAIAYPLDEEHLDYEVELAVVIGRTAFRVRESDWRSYVAGYTIVNDVSARDAQINDRKWFRGKSCDSCCPMGPWLVTLDEIPEPGALRVTATLNGQLRQDGHTSDLIFGIPQLLHFVTRNITFHPGDVIATGTPGGVGIFRDPPACMIPGDVISVWVEGIGTLQNSIVEGAGGLPSVYPSPRCTESLNRSEYD